MKYLNWIHYLPSGILWLNCFSLSSCSTGQILWKYSSFVWCICNKLMLYHDIVTWNTLIHFYQSGSLSSPQAGSGLIIKCCGYSWALSLYIYLCIHLHKNFHMRTVDLVEPIGPFFEPPGLAVIKLPPSHALLSNHPVNSHNPKFNTDSTVTFELK